MSIAGAERVMVVEPDSMTAGFIVGRLLDAGYQVSAVSTGRDALDRCAVEDPSVVIAELCLSDLDGIEVCRGVRALCSAAFVVVTADTAEQRKVDALDAGADDYVTKPYSAPELLARIRVAIRHRDAVVAPDPYARIQVGNLIIDTADRVATMAG